MTRPCSHPTCQRTPATACAWCKRRYCGDHELRHDCPEQQAISRAADDPALKRRALAERSPEHRLTTDTVIALNLLPGVRVAAFDVGGARQRNTARGEPGMPDIMGRAKAEPWAIPVACETKNSHKDACSCDSCAAQRKWGAAFAADGGIYVLARSVQQALDGVRMGLARARGQERSTG